MFRPLFPCLFMMACSLPSESDLHGTWVHLDRGSLTAFEFADSFDDVPDDNAYRLYQYASGDDAVLVQYGTYETTRSELVDAGEARPALVTHVIWSLDGSQEGQTYGDELEEWEDALSFTLVDPTGPNGRRTFVWSQQLP